MHHRTIRALPARQLQSTVTGEELSLARVLTQGTGVAGFSVTHEELLPGRRASRPHRHTTKDEMILVLSGTATVHADGETSNASAGDYVVFAARARHAHCISNDSDTVVELLIISSQSPDDVVEYTD